ncbi:hypothetical protein EBR43_03830 [bacterium]|nr:hypothetical protein [bacterium]
MTAKILQFKRKELKTNDTQLDPLAEILELIEKDSSNEEKNNSISFEERKFMEIEQRKKKNESVLKSYGIK